MKVKLTKDYLPGTPGGGTAGAEIDVPAQTASLLLGAQMIEPPDEDAVRSDAMQQALARQMDPLLRRLGEVVEKLTGTPAGAAPPTPPPTPSQDANAWRSTGEWLLANYAACNGHGQDVRLRGRPSGFSVDENGHIKLTSGHAGESVDTAGGFLAPTQWRAEMLELPVPDTIIRPRAFVLPMRTETLQMPKNDGRDMRTSLFGGVLCYWLSEGTAITASRAKYGQITLRVKDLCGLTFASLNLLKDNAVGLQAFLTRAFGKAIRFQEEETLFSGTGAGQPQGFLKSSALYKVARAAANQVGWADITNMYARMYPFSLNKAVWVGHPSIFPQLAQMSQNTGNSAPLVWIGNGNGPGGSELPPATILGRPVYFTPFCPLLGTEGDLCFCDFEHMLLGDRGELMVDSSEHVGFETREMAWRFVHRIDGMVWLAGTILDRQGWEQSPFVALSDAAA